MKAGPGFVGPCLGAPTLLSPDGREWRTGIVGKQEPRDRIPQERWLSDGRQPRAHGWDELGIYSGPVLPNLCYSPDSSESTNSMDSEKWTYTCIQELCGPFAVQPWSDPRLGAPGESLYSTKHHMAVRLGHSSADRGSFPRTRQSRSRIGRHIYRNDVNKVILAQRVQDGGDGVFGDRHPQPLHAATRVHHNHDILGGSSGLYVP